MQNFQEPTFKLDPWAASSLLQKAIRRGETNLALHAAQQLHTYRGQSVFRRLLNIAFEDVGIANPDLVSEVTFLALDKDARNLIGSDHELIAYLTVLLAGSAKDRCTDYLVCWALKSETGQQEMRELAGQSDAELASLAADPERPLLTRAVAALIGCTKDGKILFRQPLVTLLRELDGMYPSSLHQAVGRAAAKSIGSYVLMAPLLWSSMRRAMPWTGLSEEKLDTQEMVGGIPLYTFDKHTSLGKRAIARLVKENLDVGEAVAAATTKCPEKATAMAAFYVDAVPVSRKLDWIYTPYLEKLGFEADMLSVGCGRQSAKLLLNAVASNKPHLDQLRLELAMSQSSKPTRSAGERL